MSFADMALSLSELRAWVRGATPEIQAVMRAFPPGCLIDLKSKDGVALGGEVVSYTKDGWLGVAYPSGALVAPDDQMLVGFHKMGDSVVLDHEWVASVLTKHPPKRLLVFSTSTMGECELAVCDADDVVPTINEMMEAGAEGVEDITGQWKRAGEIIAHFDEHRLDVDADARAFVTKRLVVNCRSDDGD